MDSQGMLTGTGGSAGSTVAASGQTAGIVASLIPVAGPVIGGLLAIGSTIIGGLMTNASTKKTNQMNYNLAEQERQDTLNQQASSLGMQNKQLKQQAQEFQQQMNYNATNSNRTYLQSLGQGIMNFAGNNAAFQGYLKNLLKV